MPVCMFTCSYLLMFFDVYSKCSSYAQLNCFCHLDETCEFFPQKTQTELDSWHTMYLCVHLLFGTLHTKGLNYERTGCLQYNAF